MDAQPVKTGTAFNVSLAQSAKTGMLLPDLVDAHQDKTGTELLAFHVSAEDNGTSLADNVLARSEIGTDSHVSNALSDKPGIQQAFHAPAQLALSGMVLNAELAQAQADTGISNLMIVFVELETGTDRNVLFAPQIPIGTEKPASLAMVVEFGIHWT